MKKAGEFPIGRGLLSKWPWLFGVVSVTLALWGCEGSHLFAPIIVGPQITELSTAPEAIQSGESMTVSVRALGAVRVDSIVTTVRVGDFEQVGVARQVGVSSDFSAAVDFAIPVSVSDTLGTVEAYAVDGRRNVGPTVAVTVRAVDNLPPTVSLSLQAPHLRFGAENSVSVSAEDNVSLSQIGFRVLNRDGELLDEFLVSETGKIAQRVLTYLVPEDLSEEGIVVVGIAVDHAGNIGEGVPVPAIIGELIEILAPSGGAQVPGQNPLFVSVRVRDDDAVASVRLDGVAHRGDPSLGTDEIVPRFVPILLTFSEPVPDTIVQRNLLPVADATAESVFIRVAATDRDGNVSVDSVEVSLIADELAPVVQITRPADGFGQVAGDSILVDTFIEKLPAPFRTGIVTLRLEGVAFRGDPELGNDQVVERFLARTVTFDPAVLDGQVVSRYLPSTNDLTGETVFIIATAIDEWGNQGADTVQVNLSAPPPPPAPELGSRWDRTPEDDGFPSPAVFERSDSPSAYIGGQLGLPLRFTSRSKAHGTPEGKRSRDGPPDRPHPS